MCDRLGKEKVRSEEKKGAGELKQAFIATRD